MAKQFNIFVGAPVWLHPVGDFINLVKEELVESVVTKVAQFHFYCFCDNIGEVKVSKETFHSWNDNLLGGFIAYEKPEEYVLQKEREQTLEAIRNLSFVGLENPDAARNKLIEFLYRERILSKPYEGFKKKLDEKHEIRTIYGVKTPSGRICDVYKTRLEAVKQNPDKEIVIGFCIIDILTNTIPQGCNVWNDTISEAISNFERMSSKSSSKQFERSQFERNPQEKREVSKRPEAKSVEQVPLKSNPMPINKPSQKLSEQMPKSSENFMVGMRFGRLRVIGEGQKHNYLLCECDCGTIKEVLKYSLTRDVYPTRSCGCLRKENILRQPKAEQKTMITDSSKEKKSIHKSSVVPVQPCKPQPKELTKETKRKRTKTEHEFNTNLKAIENHTIRSNNTSGRTGVSFVHHIQKYQAYIGVQKKRITLGYFDTFAEAVKAREVAEEKYHLPLVEAKKMMEKEKMGA